jgi:acyl-CoA synthetase (AMP-forming)/AMP-acid ligase II
VLLSDKPVRGHRVLADIFGEAAEAVSFDGVRAHETAWLCYSSGTTGLPKGVMTTHHNITTQIQTTIPVFEALQSGRDAILGFLPLNHIYGTIYMLLLPIAYGIPTVLLPRFDEIAVLKAIEKHRVTLPLFVPPVVLRFMQSPNVDKYDLSSMRVVMSAAAPLQEDLCGAFEAKFNVKVIQAYGMTEATPGITSMNSGMAAGRSGWSGRLMPTYQARLVTEEGEDAPLGQPGELWVRSPNIMKGYHGKDNCFEPGGWFRTGDVAVIDPQGWYKIVDRMKELIKYKGLQVAPAELEALLLEHPEIVDAGVIGVYDKSQVTELPRAYVVAAPGADVARLPANVDKWVAGRVAQHKKLRGGIVVIDEIPKSPSGKILRKELRTRAEQEWEGAEKQKAKL